jgi:hypothetical protein
MIKFPIHSVSPAYYWIGVINTQIVVDILAVKTGALLSLQPSLNCLEDAQLVVIESELAPNIVVVKQKITVIGVAS